MQASWRLREQKRREEAEAAERRRAVEKSEISFPSLGNTNTGWDSPKTNETTVAAQRWSEGDVLRSTTPRSAAAPSSGGGGAGKPASSVSMGIHARIAAEVRRTTTAATAAGGWQYEDEGGTGAADFDGWTEVSKTKTKKTKTAAAAAPPLPPDDYDYDCDYDHQSEY